MYSVSLEWVSFGYYFSLAWPWDGGTEVGWTTAMHTFKHDQNTPPLPSPHYLLSIVGNPTLVNRTATVKPNRYIELTWEITLYKLQLLIQPAD